MLYLLACELHFVLVLRMAKQTHTSQTEPKDRAVALQESALDVWIDERKEKIITEGNTHIIYIIDIVIL